MSTVRRLIPLVVTLSCLLAGCSWVPFMGKSEKRHDGPPRIADVVADLPELELPKSVAARPTREDVMEAYNRVYGLIPDPGQNHAVGKRLADLEMEIGEEQDIAGIDDPYTGAVALYESLLLNSEGEGKDQILYQLSRAHDIQGETDQTIVYLNQLIGEYPDSAYIVEARFRRAEIEFSRDRFREAQRDYAYVVSLGDTTPYWQNASYMRGWSQFKLGDLEDGLGSFFTVVDSVLASSSAEELPATEKQILDDSFRVVTLALGYLDGPETLADQMRRIDKPHWQYLAYQTLADDYLEKERYLDSVATWQTFIEHNSLDARAPSAHEGMIDTLTKADFPSEIRPKKEEFINRYGIYSEFWGVHDQAVRESYIKTLHGYLSELAKFDHAAALESGKKADFLKAADYYEQIVVTFPEDPATAEYYFLLGEVYTQAAENGRAVAAYQRVVHEFLDYQRADEAGYAAILGLEELVASAPEDELELWRRLKIDAQIEFSILFSADERAPAVQTSAANSLFELEEYEQAVELSQNMLTTWPVQSAELTKTALLIVGHGTFELDDFVAAESAYLKLLNVELDSEERVKVEERLLAAVYKQGEASEAAGETEVAVAHYLRLRDLDPNADLAVQGQFDAVAVIEQAGQVDEAAALLADFRVRYPGHELGKDINKRLADMYERTENWAFAADEYVLLSTAAEDSEVRRQSLYRAAELYLDLGDVPNALGYFRDYANTYSRPMDLRMEAINHLDVIYQQLGDGDRRRVWLEKKIDLHRDMGRDATARATYLAAEAQFIFAEDARAGFDAVRLTRPLNRSLKRKQQELKKTVRAFEAAADYQVVEFATASTYYIADLYAALSTAIMDSERPTDLSELELEQYEILLEEQAFPFEEQAISLHEINMRKSWEGVYDDWVKKSFSELGRLMPARFNKPEIEIAYVETIH